MESSKKKVRLAIRHYLIQSYKAFPFLGVTELLMAPGQYPGSSGTRNLHDNLSDLRAQVAANQKVAK